MTSQQMTIAELLTAWELAVAELTAEQEMQVAMHVQKLSAERLDTLVSGLGVLQHKLYWIEHRTAPPDRAGLSQE